LNSSFNNFLVKDRSRKFGYENKTGNPYRFIKLTEQLYLDAFLKGVSMFYQDDRSALLLEFIKTNPDESEDLVRYERAINDYIFIQNLVPPGEEYWCYLPPVTVHG
jgi:hypothetical protein